MTAHPHQDPRLYFIHQPGCAACKATRKVLERWLKANAASPIPVEIRVFAVDLTVVEWKANNWAPDVTPTLVLIRKDGTLAIREGALPLEDLNTWIHLEVL